MFNPWILERSPDLSCFSVVGCKYYCRAQLQAPIMKSPSLELGRDVHSQFLCAGPCQCQHTIGGRCLHTLGQSKMSLEPWNQGHLVGSGTREEVSFSFLLSYSGKYLYTHTIIDAIYSNFKISQPANHYNIIIVSTLLCAEQENNPRNTEVSKIKSLS